MTMIRSPSVLQRQRIWGWYSVKIVMRGILFNTDTIVSYPSLSTWSNTNYKQWIWSHYNCSSNTLYLSWWNMHTLRRSWAQALSLNICTTCQHALSTVTLLRTRANADHGTGKMLNSFRQNCLNPPSHHIKFSVSNEISDGSPLLSLPLQSWCSTKFWLRNSI